MSKDAWLRVGLLALALVPIPLFWTLGERSLRALESADLRLRGRQAEVELLAGLRETVRGDASSVGGAGAARLPLDDEARTGVREPPDGGFLAHPVLLAARVTAESGARIDALESLDPLLAGGGGPEAEAAARFLAARILREAGDIERSSRLRASAAHLGEHVERPAVARWIAIESGAAGEAATDERVSAPFEAWFDEVFGRAVDLEELVLLRALARERPDGAARVARLDDRARWPERLALIRERRSELDTEGDVVLATGDGWWIVDESTARRFPSFPSWLEAARPGGASARLAGIDAPRGERDRVLSGVAAADGIALDLGARTIVLTLPAPRLFGTDAPRRLLGGAVALWGLLALLLVTAVLRHQRRSRELVAAREDLIAQVAHELRTPLTVLRLYGESLVEGRVPATRRTEYLRTIADEAARLGGLVDRVVRAAREGESEARVGDERCDAAEVVRRVTTPFRVAAEDAGGALEIDRLPDRAPARIDADELRLVLDVVLENALRHGGVPPRVHVGMEREAGVIRCLVEDEGPGLAAEDAADVDRLFERWTRGRGVRRGGAGMGLFLARRSVRARGGDVILKSGASGGVRVVVTLRAAADEEPGEASA